MRFLESEQTNYIKRNIVEKFYQLPEEERDSFIRQLVAKGYTFLIPIEFLPDDVI